MRALVLNRSLRGEHEPITEALNVTDLKVTGGRLKCPVTLCGASA